MKANPIQLIYVVLIGISPLMRFSLEDTRLPRDTWIFIGAFVLTLSILFYMYHSSVQLVFRRVAPILGLCALSSFVIGIFPANSYAFLFCVITAFFGMAIWMIRIYEIIPRTVLIATCIGCIGIYAQWGIAQFIVQHDLGMHVIGESRLTSGKPGVSSFSNNQKKYIRAYGPFAHPNSFAGSILIGTILLYTLHPSSKPYLFSVSLMYLLGLIVSFSRTGLIASAIVFFIFFIRKKRYGLIPITIIPLLLFVPLMLQRSFDSNGVALHDRAIGISWLWTMATPTSLMRGYGIGNYETALASHLTSNHTPHDPWDIAPVHSTPLLLFSELGLVISILLATLLTLFFLSYSSPILGTLLLPILIDHYFATQISPLLFLITSTLLVVQYRGGHRTY